MGDGQMGHANGDLFEGWLLPPIGGVDLPPVCRSHSLIQRCDPGQWRNLDPGLSKAGPGELMGPSRPPTLTPSKSPLSAHKGR